jgi:hypothetical protein
MPIHKQGILASRYGSPVWPHAKRITIQRNSTPLKLVSIGAKQNAALPGVPRALKYHPDVADKSGRDPTGSSQCNASFTEVRGSPSRHHSRPHLATIVRSGSRLEAGYAFHEGWLA